MEKKKMEKNLSAGTDHKDVKLYYTIFPKDWTAEQIYEYLISRADEPRTRSEPVSGASDDGEGA